MGHPDLEEIANEVYQRNWSECHITVAKKEQEIHQATERFRRYPGIYKFTEVDGGHIGTLSQKVRDTLIDTIKKSLYTESQ